MFKTLYVKLVAVLVGFALIVSIAVLLVMRYSDNARRMEVSQRVYRTYASQLVAERILPVDRPELSAFEQVFDYLKVVNPRVDAYLVGANGAILASSGKAGIPKRGMVDTRPIRDFLSEDPALPILGDDPAEEGTKRVFTATRLTLAEYGDAYLYLIIKGIRGESVVQQVLDSYVLRENVLLIGGGLLFALLASALIIRIMTGRLQKLAGVMDRFRASGFAELPSRKLTPKASRDEIDKLAGTFDEMADRILAQMQQLRQTDTTRRELVANISHDLRTPLASLQGYLETLQLKGDQLSAEEQRGYLEIALRQSEHLSQLVAKLFELAKLDAEEVTLHPEPFMLAELVQDVVQQFELTATGAGIRIGTDLPLDMPLVTADIGLIERALRNLIENSLRHTPSGGEIRVSLVPGDGRATVQVADTGCGIDAADLPRIFDRFYRGQKSRSDASGSAGLGLAITKRILELHDSPVIVASEPGMTKISFTLPYVGTAQGAAEIPANPGSAEGKPAVTARPLGVRSAAG